MAEQQAAIKIADIPAFRLIAEEVSRTQRRRRVPVDGEDVTMLVEPKRTGLSRGRPTSTDDPLWRIIGIAKDEQAADVSQNHDTYLAE
jgi:hypothetical protein